MVKSRRYKQKPVSFAQLSGAGQRESILKQAIAVGRLNNHWPEIVGPTLATKTVPFKIYNKKLTVKVDDSPLLQQLNYLKDDLLIKIRQKLPETAIEVINFRIGKV